MSSKIAKELIFFFFFIYLGIMTIPYMGQKLGFWNTYSEFVKAHHDGFLLITIPYIIFTFIRIVYIYILKKTFNPPWQQLYSFATREFFYIISFFILGCIIMPWTAKTVGIIEYNTKTIEGLLTFDPTIYFLISIPYFVFLLIRLLLHYIRKLWVKISDRESESESDNWKHLSDYKDMLLITVILFIISVTIYIGKPKPIYKEFYGKSKICECLGFKYMMEPEQVFWGKNNEDWGVCFGILHNCINEKNNEY